MSWDQVNLFENVHFRIEHSGYYRIAGFLFVLPKENVRSLSELSYEASSNLGPTLQLATRAVNEVLKPINIYCTKFGESGGSLHFHIFPRTDEITDLYHTANGATDSIDGPHLMSWANLTFTGSNEHGNIPATVELLQDFFAREDR